jgi:hypothetical protein
MFRNAQSKVCVAAHAWPANRLATMHKSMLDNGDIMIKDAVRPTTGALFECRCLCRRLITRGKI